MKIAIFQLFKQPMANFTSLHSNSFYTQHNTYYIAISTIFTKHNINTIYTLLHTNPSILHSHILHTILYSFTHFIIPHTKLQTFTLPTPLSFHSPYTSNMLLLPFNNSYAKHSNTHSQQTYSLITKHRSIHSLSSKHSIDMHLEKIQMLIDSEH